MTSQLRKDLISGRWVIIAAERSKRPDEFRPARPDLKEPQAPAFCPFCEGNEAKTPDEIFAVRREGTAAGRPGWRVRVVPNKFPALTRGAPPRKQIHGLFEFMDGVGVHEVIIESPDHSRELDDLPVEHVRDVLWTWQQRLLSIESETQYQYIQLFKNKGREAGASLSHPHTQILATPIIPKGVKEEIYGAERFFNRAKECLFCRALREELAARERIVLVNAHFAVIAPFASRFPFEMRLHPLRHAPSFSAVHEDELTSLASSLKTVLTKLKAVVSDPPYNIVLHQAPQHDQARKAWPQIERICHWYLEILPILTHVAGFEWGTGFYINPVLPEGAAKFLRE